MSQNVHLYVIFVQVLGLEPHWMGPWKMTPRFLTFSTTSTIGSSTARPTAMPPRFHCRAACGCGMQTDTKPTTGIEFRAVIASSEDEGERQRVVIEPHGTLHVADVDRDIAASDHGNSVLYCRGRRQRTTATAPHGRWMEQSDRRRPG